MLTKEQLGEIANHITEAAPGYDFLVLITPQENQRALMIASNLPKHIQPLMANAFVKACEGLATGQATEAPFPPSH